MSALLKTLTFNALQQKSIPSTYCADHELFHHVGGVALWVRMQEAYLSSYVRKNGDHESVWRVMSGLKEQQSKEVVEEPYSDTLPQELVDRLSAPETGDPGLLEELIKFVEDNRVFKEDMLALLNYLASDQCVHGYCNLVAGYEA
ncbi:hypothetical protein EC957_008435 [Mortierella hygrophila]|uniref:Uncharacterized protein n=1 Tax=Mortierella hygrophila TaxID=979708 RepID=A0A9P6K5M8_9FUNG|nr:hypothetical protein EC957_008435 [Mortierella hygrophila]